MKWILLAMWVFGNACVTQAQVWTELTVYNGSSNICYFRMFDTNGVAQVSTGIIPAATMKFFGYASIATYTGASFGSEWQSFAPSTNLVTGVVNLGYPIIVQVPNASYSEAIPVNQDLLNWYEAGFGLAFTWFGGFGLVKRIVQKSVDHSVNV